MVHLASIPPVTTEDFQPGGYRPPKAKDTEHRSEKVHLDLLKAEVDFTTSVYGSRFADEELPKQQMAEEAMPRDVAYRMIKDELSLDNNPKLK
jgi:glutamate decarboxylase